MRSRPALVLLALAFLLMQVRSERLFYVSDAHHSAGYQQRYDPMNRCPLNYAPPESLERFNAGEIRDFSVLYRGALPCDERVTKTIRAVAGRITARNPSSGTDPVT
jgi:hypothetical protein